MRKAIMLFGPTASGKTALAIQLANGLNAEIINADSKQVYTSAPIITAMPDANEFAAAPHHMFNYVSPHTNHTVADYMDDARQKAEEIWAKGNVPLFVGGTGFYLNALEHGLSQLPQVSDDLIRSLSERSEKEGTPILHAELADVDLELAANLEPGDSQRVIRGLSVFLETGKKLSDLQKLPKVGALNCDWCKVALLPNRQENVARVEARFDVMLQAGVIDEVANLLKNKVPLHLPLMKGHGIPELVSYLQGDMSIEDAREKSIIHTRQYVKRQHTWARHQYHADVEIHDRYDVENALQIIKSKLAVDKP